MKKMLAAGALGVLILGGVAVAQTTGAQNSQPNANMQTNSSSQMTNQDTATPYNQRSDMGSQNSMQDGSASQWAGERG
ncbi:hypothetical protein [Brevundimonas diminuta]|uniref:hypothetical protein n=1 Tax=Brevundimonas diminuta TaxID=293 RepID=UPI0035D8E914